MHLQVFCNYPLLLGGHIARVHLQALGLSQLNHESLFGWVGMPVRLAVLHSYSWVKLWSQIVGPLVGFSFTILGLNRDIFNVIFGECASRSCRLRYECLTRAIQPDLHKIHVEREIQDNTGDDMYENVREHVNRQLDLSWLVPGPFFLDSTSPEFTLRACIDI